MTTNEIPTDPPISMGPVPIPKNICKFLSIDENIQLSRIEVSTRIFRYVKDNNLRSSENRNIIIPDEALQELFNLKNDETLDFKNFQVKLAKIYRINKEFTIDI